MEVYYENSEKTQKIVFDGKEYGIADLDLFQHEFNYTVENNKITEFYHGVITRTIDANITGNIKKSWQELYDEMNGVFRRDIILNKPGTLHVNGSYIPCFFYASKPTEIFDDVGFQTTELKIVSDSSIWIQEERLSFSASSAASEDAEDVKKYSYTYPYRYPPAQARNKFSIDHYTDSHFQMIVYGPAARVQITINGHPYIVEHAIESGEYMVIDSRENLPIGEQLYIVKNNGEKVNVFNYRDSVYSVFKKIPPGNTEIQCSGSYGVDLILFKERSEPKW